MKHRPPPLACLRRHHPKDHQGENWVEQPGAHHLLTENTSRTKPAKLLVVFVSNTGDPLKIEDPDS
jgi:quercetin dioxygenase-like cupin family protein